MMAKKKSESNQNIENVETALSRTELFIEKHQKTITYTILIIVLLVVGYFGYKRYILQPKAEQAVAEAFVAERHFARDSFRLALEGDGVNYGFLDIIDNYGGTPYANLSKYYAGICYLNLGEFDAAIEYLRDFKSKDMMVGANAQGLLGDAYLETGDSKNAVKAYDKAAKLANNKFLSPIYLMKKGRSLEIQGEYDKALTVYNTIEEDWYGTREQREIEKYQERAKLQLNE
ncbi:MAG: tetratricopeptide repeat protein [Bacteroidota bacterium]